MSIKTIISTALLLFVAASVAFLLVKSGGEITSAADATKVDSSMSVAKSDVDNGVVVYYFHRTKRCPTCLKIEELSGRAMKEFFAEKLNAGEMDWQCINVEKPGNEHYENDYDLISQALVVTRVANSQQVEWKNLEKVWELVWEEEEFLAYVRGEVLAYLEGS